MQDGLFKNWLSNVDDRPTAQVRDNSHEYAGLNVQALILTSNMIGISVKMY